MRRADADQGRGRGLQRAARLLGAAVALLVLAPRPATAVLIATGDGTGNTSAPADDPGFANIGARSLLSVVYIGNGWVLTANHVGVGPVVFGGQTYQAVPGSGHRFDNADLSLADLLAFKLAQDPGLPALTISTATPANNALVTLVGRGRNRGAATTWSGLDGWLWANSYAQRWGTNHISDRSQLVADTQSFGLEFNDIASPPAGEHETIAANGDSGGAVFIKRSGSWQLAGILFAVATYVNQPESTALYGDVTYASDLAIYRADILAVTSQPTCSDGLDEDSDGLIDFPLDPGCSNALDTSEHSAALVCDDGLDNDGDGLIDFPLDTGCSDVLDTKEQPPCSDGLDNDSDGLIDFPLDPGCSTALDTSEHSTALVCDNGLDDDSDGAIDFPLDSGCSTALDSSERSAALVCDNGLDDDGDGGIDFPLDPGCSTALDASERSIALVCDNDVDDDSDGAIDFPLDSGCSNALDSSEHSAALVCDNGLDDDGDGGIDFPLDPGCSTALDSSERSAALVCDNGLDDDGDGLIDYPADPDCWAPDAPSEVYAVPGLTGWGAALLASGLLGLGARHLARQ